MSEAAAEPGFWERKKKSLFGFLGYVRLADLRAALYSILFMLSASWLFKRIPDLPLPVLIFIPFLYLSVIGGGLFIIGQGLERLFGNSSVRFLQKLFKEREGSITGYCRKDGARFLHAAFGVGVYMLVGAVYYALHHPRGLAWLLLPLILLAMIAIFSLNQHMEGEGPRERLRMTLLYRSLYLVALAGSIFAVYWLLFVTFKPA